MADNSEVRSNRERLLERYKAKRPDKNFDDDEAMYGQINDDFDDYENQLSGYKDREGKLANMFSKDKRSAGFLADWSKGVDPVVNLVRRYGLEIKDIIDDPQKQEEMAKANEEHVKRVAEESDLEAQYEKGLQETFGMLDSMQQEEGLSDEDVDKVMAFLFAICQDGIVGRFSKETIRMALKAINHDEDVANAGDEGEVRGRNAKIDEKLRRRQSGDGTAVLDGKNSVQRREQPKRGSTMFDLANEAM